MERRRDGRLLTERAIGQDAGAGGTASARPARSVTVNLAESPLGWLVSRGLVSQRQFDAGERLRFDWEQAQLAPRVTMAWDSAPIARGRGGAAQLPDPPAAASGPVARSVSNRPPLSLSMHPP